MRLLRIAGILCASALMLASPAAIAAPVFDKDTEFIVTDDASNHDPLLLNTESSLVAESPAFRGSTASTGRSPGVAASQNTSRLTTDLLEHAAALPPFDPG